MAIIPLRAYNREIEGMIDNGQLDEAVAHCRHILATYPKHIATYRLLGKAHLEQQRISDATDIFQRVLSAIPDDFIANVGMSIIREDENNLDASIWHMELAYEAQPSNIAIQDELRRLYGRRDGMQPPKVRLTRGALARMYAKGGLIDQAIAELRSAISEDPNRYDLQLLLAGMFFQTSQRVEAIETCVNVLKKLPFCIAANQILAVSFPETEAGATNKNYKQIAISMDPYFAFAAPDAITTDQVPDNAVNIEKYEWKPGIQMTDVAAQPSWATSLGVSVEKTNEENLPDWLKGAEAAAKPEAVEKAEQSVSPFIWDTQETEKIITEETKEESEIPDWMKDAGWQPASGEAAKEGSEEIPAPETKKSEQAEELEKGDLPDWLRGIAPEGVLDGEATASQVKEKDVSIPWLEKHQPGPTDSIIQWLEDAKPETQVTPTENQGSSAEVLDEEMPDWLKDLDVTYPTPTQAEKTPEVATTTPAVTPAFVEEPAEAEKAEPQVITELPTGISAEKIEPISEMAESQPVSEVGKPEETPAVYAEEIPDWIKELAGETPEITPSAEPEEGLKAAIPVIAAVELSTQIPSEPKVGPTIELPTAEKFAPLEEPSTAPIKEPMGEIIPPEAEIHPAEIPTVSEIQPVESTPVSERIPPVSEIPPVTEKPTDLVQPVIAEGEVKPEAAISAGEAAAIAFLGGAVAKSEQEKASISAGVEKEETLPEWVKLEAATVAETTLPKVEIQPEETPAIPAEGIPEWLKGLGETPEAEEVTTEPVPVPAAESQPPQIEELPAWMIASELTSKEKVTQTPSQETLEWKEEELPDWIKEISETGPSKEIPSPIGKPTTEEPIPHPTEPTPEKLTEEVPIAEVGEVTTSEPQVQEAAWVPEVEVPTQPEIVEVIQPEVETAALPEQPITPSIQAPEAELQSLEEARNAINQGQPDHAVAVYTGLIKQNQQLDQVIKDVQEALYRFPVDINLWMVLGDAYLRTDELQEALNAYIKAEDLVR
jgi:cytochrome c-type biogenesis protein CcmH/NrfG